MSRPSASEPASRPASATSRRAAAFALAATAVLLVLALTASLAQPEGVAATAPNPLSPDSPPPREPVASQAIENSSGEIFGELRNASAEMHYYGSHGTAIKTAGLAKGAGKSVSIPAFRGMAPLRMKISVNNINKLDNIQIIGGTKASTAIAEIISKRPNLLNNLRHIEARMDGLTDIIYIGKNNKNILWHEDDIAALLNTATEARYGAQYIDDAKTALNSGWGNTHQSTKTVIQNNLPSGWNMDKFNSLKNLPEEALTPAQRQVFDDIWKALDGSQDTGMKFIPDPDASDLTIKGAAANYPDASGLTNAEAVETLRLDYPDSPFVDEFEEPIDTFYAVEFTKDSSNGMYPNKGYPGTGNGFPSSTNGRIGSEFDNARDLTDGDKLWQVTSSGMTDTGKVWSSSVGTWVFP